MVRLPRQRQLTAKVVSLANINDEVYRFESETAVRFTPVAQTYSETMDVQAGGKTVASLVTKDFNGYYEGFVQVDAPFTLQYGHKKQTVSLKANSFLLLDGISLLMPNRTSRLLKLDFICFVLMSRKKMNLR